MGACIISCRVVYFFFENLSDVNQKEKQGYDATRDSIAIESSADQSSTFAGLPDGRSPKNTAFFWMSERGSSSSSSNAKTTMASKQDVLSRLSSRMQGSLETNFREWDCVNLVPPTSPSSDAASAFDVVLLMLLHVFD